MVAAKYNDGDFTVCGYVNGKNSYGGYTGMQPFIGKPFDPSTSGASFHLVDIGATASKRHAAYTVCQQAGVSLIE